MFGWLSLDNASGGYIIIKKDGDVLCYHLYNRNFFEEYLLKNTQFDRPSATRHDYGYVYKENDSYYIDLNVQIRFKSISAATKEPTLDENTRKRLIAYASQLFNIIKYNLILYFIILNYILLYFFALISVDFDIPVIFSTLLYELVSRSFKACSICALENFFLRPSL